MSEPQLRALDAFSGAGGCTRGYQLAGMHVTGVDIEPQPNYVGEEFVQGDAVQFIAEHGAEFDFIHASPPCQAYAAVTSWRGVQADHPDLVGPTREALQGVGVPWVMENVPEAPVRRDFLLCGTQFGLNVRRHRAFEVGGWVPAFGLLPGCMCYRNPRLVPFEHKDERAFADALGCGWMTAREGRQAIPPAFTRLIGGLFVDSLAGSELSA